MEYADNFIGKMLDNRYEILEKIGSGGMAVVYKARCHRLNRLVAIKILRQDFSQDEELRRIFHAESQAVAMLSNPNIVSVYDVGSADNVDYIVMELIEGITLKQYINRKGILSSKEALHFATQIAKALSHAHSRGIIHRDIKPHNIMILRDGSVKVTDFGIACLLSTQNTLTQQALGSVHYISPEQAQGGHIDARTDIYSLGVVMYEMLTGRLPFEGDSPVSIAIQHISSIPLSPREINPDIPKGLEMITMKAMEPNLDLRYESVDDLLYDLEEFRKNPSMVLSRNFVSSGVGAAASDDDDDDDDRRAPVLRRKRNKKPKKVKEPSESKKGGKSTKVNPALIGASLVVVIGIIAVLMWNFVIKDFFNSDDIKVTLDNFVGKNVEDITSNPTYTERYEFKIVTVESEEEEGYIISQDPAADEQITVTDETKKIKITLTVSEGEEPVLMPNIVNMDYREAMTQLENLKLDLNIKVTEASSDDVKAGRVIEQYPKKDEPLVKGGTVFITYSTGPDIEMVEVPSVTGLTESKAILRLDSYNLSYKIQYVYDSSAKGTVIFQSYEAGEEVAIHTEIVLQVSMGPEEPQEPDNPDEGDGGGEENPPEEGTNE